MGCGLTGLVSKECQCVFKKVKSERTMAGPSNTVAFLLQRQIVTDLKAGFSRIIKWACGLTGVGQ